MSHSTLVKVFAAWMVTTLLMLIVTAAIALPLVPVVAGIMIAPVWFLARSNDVAMRDLSRRRRKALRNDLRRDYDRLVTQRTTVYNDGGIVNVHNSEPDWASNDVWEQYRRIDKIRREARNGVINECYGYGSLPEPDRNCARCGVNILYHWTRDYPKWTHDFEEIEEIG